MHIPAFILEHPVEGLIAGILLLVLVFGSADRRAVEAAKSLVPHGAQIASSEKM
ncbi:MAG: hypothetical protein ABI608_04965 [Rhizomicrobium sp.]